MLLNEITPFAVRTTRNRLRLDPKFSVLCDRSKMERRQADGTFIPQIISLPDLPGVSAPKGFESPSSRQQFLLSEERFNLCKEVDDFVCGKSNIDQSAGFVPSAPHGMGKSGTYGIRKEWYSWDGKEWVLASSLLVMPS